MHLRLIAALGLAVGMLFALEVQGATSTCLPVDTTAHQAALTDDAPQVLLTEDARDIHSYAQPAVARVTHVHLDLQADFNARTLSGTAALQVRAAKGAREIVLDTRGLRIRAVCSAAGRALAWTRGAADPVHGSPLTVQLHRARTIVVHYATRPDAPALQWVEPLQTAGRVKPFLYSRGRSIQTRSWIPTQDSPGIRQTWSARITAPADLAVLMSAGTLRPAVASARTGRRTWSFQMAQPVPPHLIALAIGDLAFRPLGPRTGVYAEPAMLETAAAALTDLEEAVSAGVDLLGSYRFGRHDVLVMPPSFPSGSMESPRLSFIAPHHITQDRSGMWVIVHELAHGWAGALVSNATWADLWLNEGLTQYVENRILQRLYGPETAAARAYLQWRDLLRFMAPQGGLPGPDTRLHIDPAGRAPDAAMNPAARTKAAAFLRVVESAVGRERLDRYLRSYFDRFAFQPQTTTRFLADLRTHLLHNDAEIERRIGIHRWVHGPGLPDNAVAPQSGALSRVETLAAQFAQAPTDAALDAATAAAWTAPEWVRFLDSLPRQLPEAKLAQLEQALNLSPAALRQERMLDQPPRTTSETRAAWLHLAIANRYEPALPLLELHLMDTGNPASFTPLFSDLMAQGQWGHAFARFFHARSRHRYLPMTEEAVSRIVTP
jgi:leukotriene-A4 hydrolase